MIDVTKIIPKQLDPDKEYIIRVRSINPLGTPSTWSEGLYIDTSRVTTAAGLFTQSNAEFSILNDDGEIVFGAFTTKRQRTNLIANPSFELDAVGWSALGNSVLSRLSVQSFYGSNSGVITPIPPVTDNSDIGITLSTSDYISVAQGEFYTVSLYVYREYDINEHNGLNQEHSYVNIIANLYDGSNNLKSQITASQATRIPNNEWTRVHIEDIRIPAGVSKLGLTLKFDETVTQELITENERLFVDGVLVEETSKLDSYFDGSTVEGSTSWSGAAHGSPSVFDNVSASTVFIRGALNIGGLLESTNYSYTSGVYSDTGTQIDLSTGTFTSPNFSIDSNGDVFIASGVTVDGYIQVGGAAADINAGVTTISGDKITTGTLEGDRLSATTSIQVGDDNLGSYNYIIIEGGATPSQTFMRSADSGFGTGNGFYMDAAGRFSLGSALTYENGVLTIGGNPGGLDYIPVGGAANDINSGVTTISGGKITTGTLDAAAITAGTITADKIVLGGLDSQDLFGVNIIGREQLRSDAIRSSNYDPPDLATPPGPGDEIFADFGAFFDLSTGKFTSKGLVVDNITGDVWINNLNLDGVSIGSTLRLSMGSEATLASINHPFQIGADNTLNLIMDDNEIQARVNGSASELRLNEQGGLVSIGTGGLTTTGALTGYRSTLSSLTNLTLASTAHALTLGDASGLNIGFDHNSIQARDNSTATPVGATLTINEYGGNVNIGGQVFLSDSINIVNGHQIKMPGNSRIRYFDQTNESALTTLLGGTTLGMLIDGPHYGHIAIGLRANGDDDLFAITTPGITTDPTGNLTDIVFSVNRRGDVNLDRDLNVGRDLDVVTNVTIGGDLDVTGSISGADFVFEGNVFNVGGSTPPPSDDNQDRGIQFRWHTGAASRIGFFGFDDSTNKFTFIPNATVVGGVYSGTKGEIDAYVDASNVLNLSTTLDSTYVNVTGDTMTGTLNTRTIGTTGANAYDIGSGTLYFKNIYSAEIYGPTEQTVTVQALGRTDRPYAGMDSQFANPNGLVFEYWNFNAATPGWEVWNPTLGGGATNTNPIALFDTDLGGYLQVDYDHRLWRVTLQVPWSILAGPIWLLRSYSGAHATYTTCNFTYERELTPGNWTTVSTMPNVLYGESVHRIPLFLSNGPNINMRFTFDRAASSIPMDPGDVDNVARIWVGNHYPNRGNRWTFGKATRNGEHLTVFQSAPAPTTAGIGLGTTLNPWGESYISQLQLTSVSPTLASHATRKDYVDGVMTTHTNAADPHPQYLTTAEGDSAYVNASGDTMSGDLNMNGNDLVLTDGILFLRTDTDDNRLAWVSGIGPVLQGPTGGALRTTTGGVVDHITWSNTLPVTVNNDLLVTGDLTVQGTTTTVNSTVVVIEDPIFTMGGVNPPSVNDGKDRGIEFRYYDTQARTGFFGWDNSANKFVALLNTTNSSEVISGTKAEIDANVDFGNILNWTGTLDARYVNASGDTMTGNLYAPLFGMQSGDGWFTYFNSTTNAPLAALMVGSNSGNVMVGPANAHFVVDLRNNGGQDAFVVTSRSTNVYTDPPNQVPFTVQADGQVKIASTAGSLGISGPAPFVDLTETDAAADQGRIRFIQTGGTTYFQQLNDNGTTKRSMLSFGTGGGVNFPDATSVVVPNATADTHALNRITADGRYVNTSGDTLTGLLILDNLGVQLDTTNKWEVTLGTDGPVIYSRGVTSSNQIHNLWNAGATRWVFAPAPSGTPDNTKEFEYDFTSQQWGFETALKVGAPILSTDAATKNYVDTEILSINTDITNHIGDTTDAHDASAISYANSFVAPTSDWLTATDVQVAITQLGAQIEAPDASTIEAILAALNNIGTPSNPIDNSNVFQTGVIVADAIASGAVIASKIAANVINASHIEANSFTGNEFNAKSVIRIGDSGEIVIQGTDDPLTTSISARGTNPVRGYEEWIETTTPRAALPLNGTFTNVVNSTAQKVNGPALHLVNGLSGTSLVAPNTESIRQLDGAESWRFEVSVGPFTPSTAATPAAVPLFTAGSTQSAVNAERFFYLMRNTDESLRFQLQPTGHWTTGALSLTFNSFQAVADTAISARFDVSSTVTETIVKLYVAYEVDGEWEFLEQITTAGDYRFAHPTAVETMRVNILGWDHGSQGDGSTLVFRFARLWLGLGETPLFIIDEADIPADVTVTSFQSTSGHTLNILNSTNNDALPITTIIPAGQYNWVDTNPINMSGGTDWVLTTRFKPFQIPNVPFVRLGLAERFLTSETIMFNNTNVSVAFVINIPETYDGLGLCGFYSDSSNSLDGGGVLLDGYTVLGLRSTAGVVTSRIEYTLPGPGTYAIGYRCSSGIGGDHSLFVNGKLVDFTKHTVAPTWVTNTARVGTYYGRYGANGSNTLIDVQINGGVAGAIGTDEIVMGEFVIDDIAQGNSWFEEYHRVLFKGFATSDGFHIDASGRLSVGTSFKWDGNRYLDVGDGFRWDDQTGTLTIGANESTSPLRDFDGVWEARHGDASIIPNTGTAGSSIDATVSGMVRVEGPAIWFPGKSNNSLSVSHEANQNPADTLEIVFRATAANWGVISPVEVIVSKFNTGAGYEVYFSGSNIILRHWNAANPNGLTKSATWSKPNGWGTYWIKVTYDPDNGGNAVGSFYVADDQETEPTTWELMGQQSIPGVQLIDPSTSTLYMGLRGQSNQYYSTAQLRRMIIRDGINGPTFFDFNAAADLENVSHSVTSFVASTGQNVSVNRYSTGPVTTIVPRGVEYLNPDNTDSNNYITIPGDFDVAVDADIVIGWVGSLGGNLAQAQGNVITSSDGPWQLLRIFKSQNSQNLNAQIQDTGGFVQSGSINTPAYESLVAIARADRNTNLITLRVYSASGLVGEISANMSTIGELAPAAVGRVMKNTTGSVSAAFIKIGVGVASSDSELDDIAAYLLNRPLSGNSVIQSNNFYKPSSSYFSNIGSRWNLSTGEFITPQMSVDASTGAARFAGELIAPSGDIGGWDISGSTLTSGDVVLDAGTGQIAINNTGQISVGEAANKIILNATATDTTTYIGANATSYAQASAGMYADASGRFSLGDKLTWDGATLTVNGSGTFTGSISATSGTIGGLTVAATKIYVGTGTFGNVNTAFYVDNTGKFSLEDQLTWDGTTLTIAGDAIIDGNAIVDGTISASSLSVVAGGHNLFRNSSFENTDNYTAGWTGYGSAGPAVTATAAAGLPEGITAAGYALRIDMPSGVSSDNGVQTFDVRTIPGVKYTMSGYYRNPGANPITFRFRSQTGSSSTKVIPADNNWYRFSWTYTAATVDTFWRPFEVTTGYNANAFTVYIDHVQLEEGEVVSGWKPKIDEVLPGTITATEIAAGTITGTELNATTNITVGTGTYKIKAIGGAGTATYLGITDQATPVYNNANTPFYVGADQQLSIGNKLTYSSGVLTINGGGTFSGALSAATGTFAGDISAASGTFTGNLSGGAIDIGGADATSFHVDTSGQMWLGAATYASAPFKVSAAGALTATSGTIAGLNITSTKLYVGTGTFGNTNTSLYLDNAGQFSLKDQLTWNGTTLTIDGNAVIDGDALVSGTVTSSKLNVVTEGANLVIAGSFSGSTLPREDWIAWQYAWTPQWTIAPSAEADRGSSTVIINSGINDGIVSRAFPVEAGKTYSLRVRERWAAGTGQIYAGVYSSPNKPANGFVDALTRTLPTGGWTVSYVLHNATAKTSGSGGTGGWITSEAVWTAPNDASGSHVWASVVFLNYTNSDTTYEIDWVELVPQTVSVQIADGAITANKVATDALVSKTYTYTSGNFSDSGTFFNLASTGYIRSKNFAIDTSGNAYFKGDITGASGTFSGTLSGATITGGTISIGSGEDIFKADANGIYLGSATFANAEFSVTPQGALKSTSGVIGGWTIGSTKLSGTGILEVGTATNKIVITGTGTDTSTVLYGGTSSAFNTGTGFYLDASGRFSLGNSVAGQYVNWDGVDFEIGGTVYASGGTIGGWVINATDFASTDGDIKLDSANSRVEVGGATGIWIDGEPATPNQPAIHSANITDYAVGTGTGFWMDSSGRLFIGNVLVSDGWDPDDWSLYDWAAEPDPRFLFDGNNVQIIGDVFALGGRIGGWHLTYNTLHSLGNEIVLDAENKTITLGTVANNKLTLIATGVSTTTGVATGNTTAYGNGTGAWIGGDGRMSLGGTDLTWDGSTLNISGDAVIDGDALVNGTLTINKLAFPAPQGSNLIANYSFADGTASNWGLVEGGPEAHTVIVDATSPANNDDYVLSVGMANRAVGTKAIPITPGKTYYISAYVKAASSAGSYYVRMNWKTTYPTGDFVTLSNRNGYTPSFAENVSNSTITSWTKLEFTWTAPAGANWASLSFYSWNGSTGLYVDEVILAEQAVTTSIANGAITTEKLVATAVTSTNYNSTPAGWNNLFATAGMQINLDTGTIDSKNFVIESDGDVLIAGTVIAETGFIGSTTQGWSISASTISSIGDNIVLDSTNSRIEIGPSNEIIIDAPSASIDIGNAIFFDGFNSKIQVGSSTTDIYLQGDAAASKTAITVANDDDYSFILDGTTKYLEVANASVPDVLGDIQIIQHVALDSLTNAAHQTLVSSYTGNASGGYELAYYQKKLMVTWSTGAATGSLQSTVDLSTILTSEKAYWFRVDLDVDNGASGHTAKFYWSESKASEPVGGQWHLIDSVTSAGATGIGATNTTLRVGQRPNGTLPAYGRYFRTIIRDGIDPGSLEYDNIIAANNQFSSIPDAANLDFAGDFAGRVRLKMADWDPSSEINILGKWDHQTPSKSWRIRMKPGNGALGTFRFDLTPNNGTNVYELAWIYIDPSKITSPDGSIDLAWTFEKDVFNNIYGPSLAIAAGRLYISYDGGDHWVQGYGESPNQGTAVTAYASTAPITLGDVLNDDTLIGMGADGFSYIYEFELFEPDFYAEGSGQNPFFWVDSATPVVSLKAEDFPTSTVSSFTIGTGQTLTVSGAGSDVNSGLNLRQSTGLEIGRADRPSTDTSTSFVATSGQTVTIAGTPIIFTGLFRAATTPLYADGIGQFSIGDSLWYDDKGLNIKGTVSTTNFSLLHADETVAAEVEYDHVLGTYRTIDRIKFARSNPDITEGYLYWDSANSFNIDGRIGISAGIPESATPGTTPPYIELVPTADDLLDSSQVYIDSGYSGQADSGVASLLLRGMGPDDTYYGGEAYVKFELLGSYNGIGGPTASTGVVRMRAGGSWGTKSLTSIETDRLEWAYGDVMPMGAVTAFAGTSIPDGWLVCEGQSLPVASYPKLFAVIGYTYGGSGANFNLPNLITRIIRHAQWGVNSPGSTGGTTSINNPNHTHSVGTVSADHVHNANHGHGLSSGSTDNYFGARATFTVSGAWGAGADPGATGGWWYYPPAAGNNFNTGGISANHVHTVNNGQTGTQDNSPPYMNLYYIIRCDGTPDVLV